MYSGKGLVAIMFGKNGWIMILMKKGWQMKRLVKRLLIVTITYVIGWF